MSKVLFIPIGLVLLGILMLFAGPAVSSAEEGISNSVGNLIQNKWVAVGLILAGALWFAHDEGLIKV